MANYSTPHFAANRYSATAVISPAIERTRRFLFESFRLGRFLKLTLVAVLTEGGLSSCNFNSSVPGSSGAGKPDSNGGPSGIPHIPNWHIPQLHWPALPMLLAGLALVIVVGFLLGSAIAYLLIRLRFAYFDCVLYEQDRIAPAWARYHRPALRFLGLTWCVALAGMVALVPIGYWLYERYKPLIHSLGSETPPSFFDFLPLIGTAMLLGIGLSLVAYVVNTMLGCFVLPRMALDNASIGESLEAVWSDVMADPGAFALFLLLRALLSIAATIMVVIALIVAAIVLALVGLIGALILKAISHTLLVVLGVPALILVLLLVIAALIGASGTVGTFKRNYAILFYAGRYREMALALWPPPLPIPPVSPVQMPPSGQLPAGGAGTGPGMGSVGSSAADFAGA